MLADPTKLCHVSDGDTRLNQLVLEWERQWLVERDLPARRALLDFPIFAPEKGTLAWSEHLLGNQLAYLPLRSFLDQGTAFACWVVLCHALNFFVTLVVARRHGLGRWAALWGALLFAFSHPRLRQFGHQQTLPQFWSVLAVFAWYRFFRHGRGRDLIWASAWTAVQFWFGMYLGFALVLFGVLLVLVRLIRRRSLTLFTRHSKHWLSSAAVGLVLVAPLAWIYSHAPEELTEGRSLRDAWGFAPTPVQLLHPCEFTWLGQSGVFAAARPARSQEEKVLYPGLAVLAALAVALRGRFRRPHDGAPAPEEGSAREAAMDFGWAALLLFLSCLRWSPVFAAAWHGIPGFYSIRAPGRLALLLPLPLLIALAPHLLRHARLTMVLCMATAVEALGTFPAADARLRDPAVHAGIAAHTGVADTVVHLPLRADSDADFDTALNLDYLWGLPLHWRNTVNGYSGLIPGAFRRLADFETQARQRGEFPRLITLLQQHARASDLRPLHVVLHFDRMEEDYGVLARRWLEESGAAVPARGSGWAIVSLGAP